MDYKKQNVQNYFLYDTQVENLFLSEYMPSAPENAVKVYLLALMHVQQGLPLDSAALAKKLRLSAEDVDAAWDHWYKAGLVRLTKNSAQQGGGRNVELLNIREMVFGRRPEGAVSVPESAPFALDDAEFSRLLQSIESATGRLLEAREPEEVASWISEYGMAPEVILLGYKYCTQRGKSNRCRYVGAILKDWRAKGLVTADQVEDSLAASDRHYEYYRAVMKELGFHRSASEPEKRIMDSWFDKMGCSLDEVKDACRATTGIGNPNINYVNSVLVSRYNEKNASGSQKVSEENIFAKVNALYESIREENARKTEQIRSEVFTKIPRIRSIMDEIRACGVAASRAMLRGGSGTAEVARQKEKAEELGREKARLLASFGYAPDALDARYSCPKCRDTGVLDDGSRCSCFKEKAEALLKKQ
ncbi:MAG: DnaD domain protein [Firmicutes bacterium]|nr:DnaD domain protein [Bacillota bacterium]